MWCVCDMWWNDVIGCCIIDVCMVNVMMMWGLIDWMNIWIVVIVVVMVVCVIDWWVVCGRWWCGVGWWVWCCGIWGILCDWRMWLSVWCVWCDDDDVMWDDDWWGMGEGLDLRFECVVMMGGVKWKDEGVWRLMRCCIDWMCGVGGVD